MILHSQIIGEGEPLVILHGFLGMGDNWRTLGRRFAQDGFQVHLVDQRNHGRSFHDETFSYEVMADDLEVYCQEYQLEHIHLIGHSMGGKTAMQFATTRPGMVKRLLVADIAPKKYPSHHQDILKGLDSLDFSVIEDRSGADEALARFIPETGIRQFLLKNLYWEQKGVLGLRINLPVLIRNVSSIGEPLPEEAYFEGPALFLAGEHSGYIQPMDELHIKQHFPAAQIDTVSAAGHWLHAENPEEFYQKSLDFLNA